MVHVGVKRRTCERRLRAVPYGWQTTLLPLIGRAYLPHTVAANSAAILCGSEEWQLQTTRGNPLVFRSSWATSAPATNPCIPRSSSPLATYPAPPHKPRSLPPVWLISVPIDKVAQATLASTIACKVGRPDCRVVSPLRCSSTSNSLYLWVGSIETVDEFVGLASATLLNI